MSRGALNYVLQMSAVQLNVVCKVVDNTCTFLLDGRLKLLIDGCFQCSNGCPARCCLWETAIGRNLVVQVWWMRCPFHFGFVADEALPKHFTGSVSSMRGSTTLLESMFLMKVSTSLELFSSERPLLYLNDCETPCIYKLEISRKHYFIIIKA